jgi:benzoyl-CoA 2,3-dioxygenase component B
MSPRLSKTFARGLKGRLDEARFAEHLATDQSLRIEVSDGKGGVTSENVPMRSAMRMR